MHNPEFNRENKTHKLLWDSKTQTDHLILARRPDLVIVKRKKKEKTRTCRIMDIALLRNHRVKIKESKKRDKYRDFARGLKKTME